MPEPLRPFLHRVSLAVVAATLVMISIGALVTSRDAGLSIPDGVSNHGAIVPTEQLRSGYVTPQGRVYSGGEVLTELVHRYWGWMLGLLILGQAILTWKTEPRGGLRYLTLTAVALVALQGAVGALGVQLKQPALMVIPHAILAQALLATVVSIAYWTSKAATGGRQAYSVTGSRSVFLGFATLTGLTFAQTLLGAAFRHTDALAALAGHVTLAFVLVMLTVWLATRAQAWNSGPPQLSRMITGQGALLMLQIFLGFIAWLFRKPKNVLAERGFEAMVFPTAHVLTGALLLAGFVVLTWTAKTQFTEAPAGGSVARGPRGETAAVTP